MGKPRRGISLLLARFFLRPVVPCHAGPFALRRPLPIQTPSKKSGRGHSDLLVFPKPGIIHCLSYTAVLVNFLPVGSVPLTVTVRLLPSAATTTRPLVVTLPPFLTLNPSVWSSIFVYDRMS